MTPHREFEKEEMSNGWHQLHMQLHVDYFAAQQLARKGTSADKHTWVTSLEIQYDTPQPFFDYQLDGRIEGWEKVCLSSLFVKNKNFH